MHGYHRNSFKIILIYSVERKIILMMKENTLRLKIGEPYLKWHSGDGWLRKTRISVYVLKNARNMFYCTHKIYFVGNKFKDLHKNDLNKWWQRHYINVWNSVTKGWAYNNLISLSKLCNQWLVDDLAIIINNTYCSN